MLCKVAMVVFMLVLQAMLGIGAGVFNRASATVSNANMLEGILEAVKTAAWPAK